eukprot:10783034-Alexandrium_andersonii.AAC.1
MCIRDSSRSWSTACLQSFLQLGRWRRARNWGGQDCSTRPSQERRRRAILPRILGTAMRARGTCWDT